MRIAYLCACDEHLLAKVQVSGRSMARCWQRKLLCSSVWWVDVRCCSRLFTIDQLLVRVHVMVAQLGARSTLLCM